MAERGTGLAPRAIGVWTLRFAIGRGAEPPDFPTTEFAVGMPDKTAVRSLGDADDRPDPTDNLSANCAVRSGKSSKFRGDTDV